MADKITNDITLLFKTKLDEQSKKEVGKNLKGLLENAAIGFDEAETKRNLEPIVRMMQKLFDKAEIAFDADKLLAMPSRQALEEMAKMEVSQLQMAFDKALSKSGGVKIDFGDIGLSELAAPIKQIESELSDISRKIADTTKKSVYEIEQSLKSVSKNKNFKNIASPESIENTLIEASNDKKIHPSRAADQLEKARDLYETSVKENNPWVVQYKYLLDFVSKYEKLTNQAKTKIEAERPEFKQLYDMLSPKSGAVKISLEHFVDVSKGNELSEYKNQPWGRETTLKEIRDTLKSGISVKEGSGGDNNHKDDTAPPWEDKNGDTSPKKPNTKTPLDIGKSDVEKSASDAVAQEQQIINQKIEETQNKIKENEQRIAEIKKDISSNKSFKMYKGIGAEDAADFDDRDDVYSTYRADYYSSDIKAAASYAADEESHIVVAEIAPKDALMFNAKDYSKSGDYSEVLSSPAFIDDLKAKLKNKYAQSGMSEQKLQKKYAEIDKLELIVGDLFGAESNQVLVNEAAYDAGFDSVIFDNVLDFATNTVEGKAEGEGLSAKRQTGKTIAVLKDEILKIIGFHKVEETRNGQSVSKELLKEIPDYYHMPYQENEDGDLESQSVVDFSDGLKKNAELEAEVDVINKQNKKLKKELQELKGKVNTEVNSKVDNISNVEVVDADQSVRVETDTHQQNTEAIKQEVAAEKELNDVKTQVVDTDDDAETIAKENGALADKLELLRDIAEQYGNNITQKTRNRYEELNQKDMNDGLTEKEEERFSELGDQIIEADEALEEFEKTYDKIILKLANGKKVEILPDDKGLRSLYKFADGYGEEYDGVEIDDVVYQRVQKEAMAHQENTAAIVAENQATDELNQSLNAKEVVENSDNAGVEIAAEKAETDAINQQNEALKENIDLRAKANAQGDNVVVDADAGTDDTKPSSGSTEVKASIDTEELRGLLNSITYNVKVVQDAEPTEDNKVSINVDELKSVLSGITYNVNLAQGTAENEPNKISIDEASLENLLQRVTYNVNILQNYTNGGDNGIDADLKESIKQSILMAVEYADGTNRLNHRYDDAQEGAMTIFADGTIAATASIIEGMTSYEEMIGTEFRHLSSSPLLSGHIHPTWYDDEGLKGSSNFSHSDVNAALNSPWGSPAIAMFTGNIVRLIDLTDITEEQIDRFNEALYAESKRLASERPDWFGIQDDSGMLNLTTDLDEARSLYHQAISDATVSAGIKSEYFNAKYDVTNPKELNTLVDRLYDLAIASDKSVASVDRLEDILLRIGVNTQRPEIKKLLEGYQLGMGVDELLSSDALDDALLNPAEIRDAYVRSEMLDDQNKNPFEVVKAAMLAETSESDTSLANTEIGNVLATETTLSSIKTAVEAINSKVVKGTKANTSKQKKNIEKRPGSSALRSAPYSPDKKETAKMSLEKLKMELKASGRLTDELQTKFTSLSRSLGGITTGSGLAKWNEKFRQLKLEVGTDTAQNSALRKQAEELGVWQAKAEKENTQEAHNYVAELQQKIEAQQKSLQLTKEERDALAQITEEVRRSTLSRLSDKRADKDTKKAAANAKKLAQRDAMLGKAGSAVNRAENTWLSAAGIEELPADFVNDIDRYYDKLVELRQKHQELKDSDIISEEQKRDVINQTRELNNMTNEIGELVAEYQKLSGDNATVIGANALGADAGLSAYEQQLKQTVMTATNGKAQIKNFDAATRTLTYTVKTGKNEFTEYTAAVRRADGALVSVQGTTKRTETFLEATKRKMKEISSYMSGMSVISKAFQLLRQGIQYVREIDLALTELKKVTDETEESYDKFLETAAKTADKVGSTIQKVVSSTADWARLGYSMEQAAKFAESTQILMNVSEFTDVSQATDTLISSVQAFGYTADTSMEVVDLLNTIGNNYAISTADLAQSLTKSSASLVAAGGDLAEAAALTATANAIIQDADAVGTALKTTSLRLRGTDVKVLEEEGVDSDGAVSSKSKLQSKVKALSGVDILTETGDYKSTYQILSQIADVWEDISNMDQAALLELLAGKRNASVLAAILQSPEELKAAYEDAQDAEGSALKENEKYLDSIQGRIDQFNNALQSMWSNILNDDIVKRFVNFGTTIIKIIDEIGLLTTALLALGAYKGFGMVFGTLKDAGISIDFITKKLGSYLFGINATSAAESKLTQVELQNKLVKQGLTEENAKAIIAQTGLGVSTDKLSRETFEATMNELGYDAALVKTTADKIFGTAVTNASAGALLKETIQRKLANSTLVQFAIQMGVATAAEVANMSITGLLATSLKGLAAAFKALWVAIGPVGWAILAIVAVATACGIAFASMYKSTKELREELTNLQSELEDIQSDLKSVNSELETTQERMAELLAKDTLSFVEQEELDRLKKENDELQRKLDLIDLQNKQKSKEAAKKFSELMTRDENAGDDRYYTDGSKANWFSDLGLRMGGQPVEYLSESKTIDLKIEQYKKYAEDIADLERQIIAAGGEETDIGKELKKEKDKIDAEKSAIETYMTDKQDQWIKDSEGIEYFTGDNLEDWQIESNKWLDMINDTRDKWAIASGGNNAMSNAIKSVLGREEFSDESDQINKYVEDLKAGDTSAKESIEGIINSNTDLKNALAAKGLNPEDAISYFTDLSSTSAFDTLKGKIAEVSEAATNFEKLLKGDSFKVDGVDTGLTGLFDEDGKIIQTKLSQVFQDTSDQTRAEITKLLEGSYDMIADGLDDSEINYLMNRLGLSFSRAILEVEETSLANKNLELFPGLEDEISGIIDTFSELTSAVGSVVDALDTLDQARAEEAYSGSMSLETLEALMKSTDDYADLIEVDETGAIKLATNAQEILVYQKLDAIKKNAELALKEAELTYQEALHNEQTYTQTGPAQEFMRGLWNEVGGAMSFVSSLWGDLTSGNWSGAWDRAKAAQEATVTKKETDYANKAVEASAAVADAAKKVENAEKMNKIAQGLTPDNIRARYSSEEASGGNKTKEDVEEDAFQRAMDYWENRIAANQARYEQLQHEIDLLESKGQKADASYYEEQIKLENERLSLLQQQKAEAQSFLGTFTEGSEEWF